jgi:RND family efflux transporter MFP subunit
MEYLMNHKKTILKYIMYLSILTLLISCSKQEKQQVKKEIPPIDVKVITIKKESIPIWMRYTGITKASSDQEVRARVSGVLKKRYFKDGQQVKKGQKLFKIEQESYIAALNAAKAKKAQDKASLQLAIANVQRYKPLVKEGLAPRATLEQYQAKQAGLRAAIEGDTANINKAKLELSYTIIKAPISGKISSRYVDIGNLVGYRESTLLTTITKIDPLYVYFSPSQSDAYIFQKYKNKEKPDAFIELKSGMENIRLDGFVDFSDNSVDPLTSTISMRATISNPKNKVLPGTFVYVNIFINDKYKFLMIPPDIIFNDQLGKYIYVLKQDNTIKKTYIKTGYSTKYYINVKEGLKDGDKVIISALMKLKDDIKVIPTDVTETEGIKAVLKEKDLIPESK